MLTRYRFWGNISNTFCWWRWPRTSGWRAGTSWLWIFKSRKITISQQLIILMCYKKMIIMLCNRLVWSRPRALGSLSRLRMFSGAKKWPWWRQRASRCGVNECFRKKLFWIWFSLETNRKQWQSMLTFFVGFSFLS